MNSHQQSVNQNIYQQEQQQQQLSSSNFDFNQPHQEQLEENNIYLDTCSEPLLQHFIQDYSFYVQQNDNNDDVYPSFIDGTDRLSVPTINAMPSRVNNVTNTNTNTKIEYNSKQQQQPKVRTEQDVFNELMQMAATTSSCTSVGNSDTAWLNEFNIDQLENPMLISNGNSEQSLDGSFSITSRPNSIYLKPLESTIYNVHDLSTPLPSIENDRIYKLEVVQQPARARMCGFGDKDRRPISPPPILKVSVSTKSGLVVNPETLDVSFLVVTCDAHQRFETSETADIFRNVKTKIDTIPTVVIDEHGNEQYNIVRMRNLAGASVASAEKLYDLDGNLGIFFIFQDISLRTEGVFRLEFSLINIEEPPFLHCVNTNFVSPVMETVATEPFTSYTPKHFPGVVQPTPLSECFARQGIKIPVRKEKIKKRSKMTLSTAQFLSDMEKDC